VSPLGDLLAEFLTHSYVRPMLELFYGYSPEQSARFSLKFDANPILSAADESNVARALFDRDAISFDSLLAHSGFEDGDAPAPNELVARRALALITRNANLAPYLIHLVDGFADVKVDIGLGVKTAPAQIAAPKEPDGSAPAAVPDQSDGSEGMDEASPDLAGGGLPPAAPDSTAPAPSAGPPDSGAPALTIMQRLAGAAEGALDRALERAGARVLTASRRNEALSNRLAKVDKTQILATTTAAELRAMGLTFHALFHDAWDPFTLLATPWVRAWLESTGMDPLTATSMADHAVRHLTTGLDQFMTSHLHRRMDVQGDGLRIPAAAIEDALSLVTAAVPA
jgi:hypothetical protein